MTRKISALGAAGTLTGSELIEVVQGGATKRSTTGSALSLLRPLDGTRFNFLADGSDETAKLNAAIQAAIADNCGLVLPAGTVGISEPLTSLSGTMGLFGNGYGTILKPLSNSVTTLFDVTGAYVEIRGFRVDGSAIASPTFKVLNVNSTGLVRLDDLWFKATGDASGCTGMTFPAGNACIYTRMRIEGFDICVQSGGTTGVYPGDTTWRDIVLIPTGHTGTGWIIDGNTNAQRVHHMVTIGGLNGVYLRGTGGNILPDGIQFMDGCNLTQTDGSVVKIKKGQNILIGDRCVIGGSTAECGIEISAAADSDIDGVLVASAEIRANFKEGIRWTGGANLAVMSSHIYANSDGNATLGTPNCSNLYVGANAKGKLNIEGSMLGASKSGYVYANIAGAALYAIEMASGALTDVANFPGEVHIVGNDLRGCYSGSLSDASAPTGSAKLIAENLMDAPRTWTPALKFGGASVGMTYAVQSGQFEQVAPGVVNFAARIQLTSKGSSMGAATVTGLPMTNSATFSGAVMMPYYGNMASLNAPAGYVGTGATSITLTNADATAHAAMDSSCFTDSSEFYLVGTFMP